MRETNSIFAKELCVPIGEALPIRTVGSFGWRKSVRSWFLVLLALRSTNYFQTIVVALVITDEIPKHMLLVSRSSSMRLDGSSRLHRNLNVGCHFFFLYLSLVYEETLHQQNTTGNKSSSSGVVVSSLLNIT